MKILVTGGAGYIGAQMVLKLLEKKYQPIVVDNLSTGFKSFVPHDVPLHIFNLQDTTKLTALFQQEQFDAVFHFAAAIDVGESVQKPDYYYENNFSATLNLLQVMQQFNVHKIIFSSTAAVFGEPEVTPVAEHHPKNAINPYGLSKWMCEKLLQDMDSAYGMKSVSLRYFNAAGADSRARIGYRPNDVSHLIPIVLQAALGKRAHVNIFGQDYPTPDGTCVRDYIHVEDLCTAHLLALNYLQAGGKTCQYNLGNNQGYSVQEVIDVARQVTNKKISTIHAARRAGDPAILIADASLIQKELGWQPQYPALQTIIQHAWQWEQTLLTQTA